MSDIFREVDEALSREKAATLWKNYGPTLVGAALILILSTAATTAYRHWNSSENKKETAKLVSAAGSEDVEAAMIDAAKDTRDPHKAIALISAGHKAASDKDFAKAGELYKQAADDKSAPENLRDLAIILFVRTTQQNASEAKIDYKALLDKLVPIAKNEKSAFQAQAKLEAALLYGEAFKDYTQALDLLKGIDEKTASGSLKEKADALSHVYEYELSNKPAQE